MRIIIATIIINTTATVGGRRSNSSSVIPIFTSYRYYFTVKKRKEDGQEHFSITSPAPWKGLLRRVKPRRQAGWAKFWLTAVQQPIIKTLIVTTEECENVAWPDQIKKGPLFCFDPCSVYDARIVPRKQKNKKLFTCKTFIHIESWWRVKTPILMKAEWQKIVGAVQTECQKKKKKTSAVLFHYSGALISFEHRKTVYCYWKKQKCVTKVHNP